MQALPVDRGQNEDPLGVKLDPAKLAAHDTRVRAIADEIRARVARGEQVSLHKAGVSHFVPDPHDPRHRRPKIDVRALREILHIDAERRVAVVEPGVAFCDLARETLKVGLLPLLVPELKTITVGGAVAGCSVESMSFRYGGFHDTCLAYELVTGAGEVLEVSPAQHPELFHMVHGSYGTLGVLAKVTFKLIPAKPYVRMKYLRYSTFDDFERALRARCDDPSTELVDGIIHAKDDFVVCLGTFVDETPYTSDYTFLKIFYKSTRTREEDYLATYDYLFRYDTECHWLTRSLPIPFMESVPMRLLFGKMLLGSTNLLTWAKRLRPLLKLQKRGDIVIDLFIPAQRFREFNEWYEKELDYYPMWVVPYRVPAPYPWIDDAYQREIGNDLFIDCAIYGKKNDEPGKNLYRLIEEKVFELRGLKALIAENYYDEETFWRIYSRERYTKTKARTDPHGLFPGLYEKLHHRKRD